MSTCSGPPHCYLTFFSVYLVNQGLLGHGPGMNNMNNMNMHMQMPMNGGYPPNNPPGGPRFNHPPPPHNHGPPFNAGGGPRMMGPPPGQGRGDNGNYWGDDSMRGGPHRGGHFHRGGRGRGGEPGFRGRGRGGPRGGHNNMNGMWDMRLTLYSQIMPESQILASKSEFPSFDYKLKIHLSGDRSLEIDQSLI